MTIAAAIAITSGESANSGWVILFLFLLFFFRFFMFLFIIFNTPFGFMFSIILLLHESTMVTVLIRPNHSRKSTCKRSGPKHVAFRLMFLFIHIYLFSFIPFLLMFLSILHIVFPVVLTQESDSALLSAIFYAADIPSNCK